MSAALRPYQCNAVAAALTAYVERKRRSVLSVMPTGTGKTVVFAALGEHFISMGQRVLILAHTDELVDQARKKAIAWTGHSVDIEKAGSTANLRGFALTDVSPFVVASVQSLRQTKRLARFPADEFGLIIIDECHRAPAAGYRKILDHFPSALVAGYTATPDRGDGLALGQVFEEAAFEYPLREAIGRGYLVPPRSEQITVDGLDLSGLKKRGGDFVDADLDKIMAEEEQVIAVADPTFKRAGNRSTVVFCPGVATAKLVADQLNRRRDGCAVDLNGETDKKLRREYLAAFAAGEIQFIANCMVLTEGFDEPRAECVAIARPTKSRALYAQMLGRGLRPCPEIEKRECLVLDFIPTNANHALVTSMDVLAGDMTPKMKTLTDALAKARPELTADQILAIAEEKTERERQQAQQLKERRGLVADAVFRVGERPDPFAAFGLKMPKPAEGARPASYEQLADLKRLKFDAPVGLDEHQAGRILRDLKMRPKHGLCTAPMAALLRKAGIDGSRMRFDKARKVIDALAGARWKLTPEIRLMVSE